VRRDVTCTYTELLTGNERYSLAAGAVMAGRGMGVLFLMAVRRRRSSPVAGGKAAAVSGWHELTYGDWVGAKQALSCPTGCVWLVVRNAVPTSPLARPTKSPL